jgi:Rab-3A-interacting protein
MMLSMTLCCYLQLSERLYRAIESNELVIEPVTLCSVSEEATTDNDKSCDLSGDQACTYRFKLPDSPSWYYMTPHCRDRIVSVCEFYTFIGYIKKGIIKKEVAELYWQVARHRAVMGLARLSLTLP